MMFNNRKSFFDYDSMAYKPAPNAQEVIRMNIIKEEDKYKMFVPLAGYSKENISIEYKDNMLKLIVSEKKDGNFEGFKYYRRDFSYGSKKRSFRLPKSIDIDAIDAKMDNGILEINLPIIPKEKRIQTIKINH